jgi:capsular polysaccharide biosynthesis protein
MIFSDYLRIFRRFMWLIAGATVIGAAIGFVALAVPKAKHETVFSIALAPNTKDTGVYGNLIDALDRRSVPSTFAQVIMSPTVRDTAATDGHVSPDGLTVKAVVVTDSNVVEATIDGANPTQVRDYAAALLNASTTTFTKTYSLYSVTPLRQPTTTTEIPRHLVVGIALGAFSGALVAYLFGLAIDANRRARGRARLEPAPLPSSVSQSGSGQ